MFSLLKSENEFAIFCYRQQCFHNFSSTILMTHGNISHRGLVVVPFLLGPFRHAIFLEKCSPPQKFWPKPDSYPDLVSQLHVQVRLIGNFGLNAEVPWFYGTELRAISVLYAKKMRTTLITFLLNARR